MFIGSGLAEFWWSADKVFPFLTRTCGPKIGVLLKLQAHRDENSGSLRARSQTLARNMDATRKMDFEELLSQP